MKGAYVQMCRHHLYMLTELTRHFNKLQTARKVFTLQLQQRAQQHIPLDETVRGLTLVLQQQACNNAKKHYEPALLYAPASGKLSRTSGTMHVPSPVFQSFHR